MAVGRIRLAILGLLVIYLPLYRVKKLYLSSRLYKYLAVCDCTKLPLRVCN
jgi:hypothetical protein